MDTLYHYCPSEKFRAIVQSKTLRLSSLTLSNDTSEGKMVLSAISRVAEKDGLSQTRTQRLLGFIEGFDNVFDGLGFCMSEEPDQLSQWRGYADDGSGVAIGFSKNYLELLSVRRKDQKLASFQVHRAVYDPAEHDARVEPTYRKAKEYIDQGALDFPRGRTILDTRTDEEVEADRKKWRQLSGSMGLTILRLFSELYVLKSPAFREEKEWRLIAYRTNSGDQPCEFHAVRDRIVPFMSLTMEQLDLQAISEVVLGPKHITPPSVIQDFLDQRGFKDVRLRKSEASYR